MEKQRSSTARRILVVDDNPAVLKLIGTLFEEEGIAVKLAKSVAEARRALQETDAAFDLVLSDISMPVETGFDLLQWIKAQRPPISELPVLLTTAQLPEAENRLKGLAMGAVDYVVRPIELKELVVRTIKAINHFRKVKNLETMLQTSENLAMAGRLLAASTHEMKNLASLVHLASGRLQKDLTAASEPIANMHETLRCLVESSALLTDVARHASSLLDPSTIKAQPVDLGELLEQVVRLMTPRVRPVLLEIAGAGGKGLWAAAQAMRLKQVLINLVLNAGEAIEELAPDSGGRITLSVEDAGDSWIVAVKDNGIGLSRPGERTEFEPFATTKKLRGGQGLGLWLCARLIDAMGGSLALASDGVGKGAKAKIRLKKTPPPAKAEEAELCLEDYLID